ncbi:MAG: alanine racemase [Gammaproteobacteria bacterium]|nr:alanine racemase [Gammaproteobacteria bacterium]
MSQRAWVTLNSAALRHNLAMVRHYAPQAKVMAAIKADGYGHGLLLAARALQTADAFAIATIGEAERLRQGGVTQPLILLEGVHDAAAAAALLPLQVTPVLHSTYQLALLQRLLAENPRETIPLWLKLDSGMHRLGFRPEVLAAVIAAVQAEPRLQLQGVMSHFACADDPQARMTEDQIVCYERSLLPYQETPLQQSLANSAAILTRPATHRDWVRPGIMLYGCSPLLNGVGSDFNLQPVMRFYARLIAVRQLLQGETIGYGATWQAPDAMAVGVVSVGYGDGYPRHAAAGTPVALKTGEAPLIGRVSMDMITIDLRQHPDACVGDVVELWGDTIAVERVAAAASTISYELLCGIGNRVQRISGNEEQRTWSP